MVNDALRRIMAEVKEFAALNSTPGTFFYAVPLESDLFEWHFSVRGPPDTPFENGVYHGRILLPPEYPLKAPEIILLTPNGRFEVGTRICLSVTSHHQETWQPSWGIRTILTALVGFMPSKAEGLGALDYPPDDRRGLARKSHMFKCARCGALPIEQVPLKEHAGVASSSTSSKNGSSASSSSAQNVARSECETDQLLQDGAPAVSGRDESEDVSETCQAPGSGDSAQSVQSVSLPPNQGREGVVVDASTVLANPRRTEPIRAAENSIEVGGTRGNISTDTGPSVQQRYAEEDAVLPVVDRNETLMAQSTDARDMQSRVSEMSGNERGPSGEQQERVEEKELLYLAYAVVALMIAVVARRVFKILSE